MLKANPPSGKGDVFKYDPDHEMFELYDADYAMEHEVSHRADILYYRSWENNAFNAAIENRSQKTYDMREEIESWFADNGEYTDNISIADICGVLSNSSFDLPAGHPAKYWAAGHNKQLEIFADLSTVDILNRDAFNKSPSVFDDFKKAYIGLVGGR